MSLEFGVWSCSSLTSGVLFAIFIILFIANPTTVPIDTMSTNAFRFFSFSSLYNQTAKYFSFRERMEYVELAFFSFSKPK